jgi:hypothetical protein
MRRGAISLGLLFLILVCGLASVLGLIGGWTPSPEYRQAVESMQIDTAHKLRWIRIVFWGGLTAIALLGLAGAVGGLLRLLWRRSRLIGVDPSGLFPIVENRAGGQIYYHDPNRQWAGTTIYGTDAEGIAVRHAIPLGQQEAQFQLSTQAQATQFVAAANQGRGLSTPARRLVERMVDSSVRRPVPRLPEVVVLDEALPEDRRLLAALHRDWTDGEGSG